MQTTTITVIDRPALAGLGFNSDKIERLATLRAGYDRYREYCACNREYEQLCFLKWRYAQGEMTETIVG